MKNNAPFVNFRRLSIPTPWWLVVWVIVPVVLFKMVRALVRLIPVIVRNWRSLGLLCLTVWIWHRYGGWTLLLTAVLLGALVAVWWWRWRASCDRWVLLPVLSWWRRLFVYQRQWREALTLCRLAEKFDGRQIMPKLLRVRCTYATDEILLRMPRGQNPELYHKASVNLAYSFGSRHCRVFSGRRRIPPARTGRLVWLVTAVDRVRFRDRPRLVWLVFIRRDPLTRIVPALPVPAEPDFTALALALREDLAWFRLRLLATHVLIVGATRSGKGSVQWSLIRAMANGIRTGLVRLWGIDPKGGMELSIGRGLFSRYEYSDVAPMVDMLEDLVAVMRDRQRRLQGIVRVHTPTVDDPLYVLMVDEMLALIALLQDVDLRNRVKAALMLLLTQGAGLGVLVIGATQDPRKEVIELRDFFPTRIGLRLNEPNHVDLVLGDGARNRGALCDQLSDDPSMRGIGYVVLDDQPEPARVRFTYINDDDIRAMAHTYAAPPDRTPTPAPTPTPRPVPRQHTYRPGRPTSGPLLPERLTTFMDGGDSA